MECDSDIKSVASNHHAGAGWCDEMVQAMDECDSDITSVVFHDLGVVKSEIRTTQDLKHDDLLLAQEIVKSHGLQLLEPAGSELPEFYK